MKNISGILLIVFSLISCSNFKPVKKNLEDKWDAERPLANPDKGWYHHMLDNGVHKYLIQDDKELTEFPGMDHLYLRLCWAFLEPEEGKYDWSYIDDIIEKYVPKGYQVSFRISCKETGGAPGSVPKEINGVKYATPYWVKKAGAKGIDCPEFGNCSWTPEWNDPIFLEKLNNFHKAFAEKYDGKPYVRYVDVGSIGEWGEGHTHRSTRIPPSVEEIKAHIDLHLKHYKNTQIVVTDDLLYWNKSEEDVNELFKYVLVNNITFRDDSPLVRFYMEEYLDTWTVSHPHFFEAVYKKFPTVFELQHYKVAKEKGSWRGKNGADIIPEFNVIGADIFKGAMKHIKPTYIGFHGYLGDWLIDNPDLTVELLNMSGYWYFPKSVEITETTNQSISFNIEWLNKGVAPAYSSYALIGKIVEADEEDEVITTILIQDSGNKDWMPGESNVVNYSNDFGKIKSGKYILKLKLQDLKSTRDVEIGLSEELKDKDGFFEMIEFEI